jgi:hypothetical protein
MLSLSFAEGSAHYHFYFRTSILNRQYIYYIICATHFSTWSYIALYMHLKMMMEVEYQRE